MSDNVNHPQHYTQCSATLEPIDVIRDCPFDLGNAIKYICRAGHKNDELEDLLKAKRYITWAYESCSFDSGPYDYFVKSKGILMQKLTPFKDFRCVTARSLIFEIKRLIDSKIQALANERNSAE